MEVETQSLSNFELNSKPEFSYSVNDGTDVSELQSPEFRGSEMPQSPSSDATKTTVFDSPAGPDSGTDSLASGRRKCKEPEIDFASTPDAVTLDADRRRWESSESDGTMSPAGEPMNCKSSAAMKVQKVYRSYRTRRMLADSAVVAEELWWQAIDYARLNYSTISFFNFLKPETAASRWHRICLNASKIDPRHRYGHCLHIYYEEWCKTDASQPFFFWLDLGDGKEVDLKECPRSKLQQQCIKYLGPVHALVN